MKWTPRFRQVAGKQLGSKAMRYDEMAWRSGEVLYWTFTVIAGLIVLLVVANYMFDTGRGESVIRTIPLLLAGANLARGVGLPPCVRWTLKFVRHDQTETPATKRMAGNCKCAGDQDLLEYLYSGAALS
jgi:hypothetical protein